MVSYERIYPALEQDTGVKFVGSGEQGDSAGVDHDVGDEGVGRGDTGVVGRVG